MVLVFVALISVILFGIFLSYLIILCHRQSTKKKRKSAPEEMLYIKNALHDSSDFN